jgi:hypothetical protein
MGLRKQDAILGYTWLKEHNLEVNWVTKKVKISHCPGCCSTCRKEIKQEHHQCQTEACHLCACCTGPMPTMEDVSEDILELYPDTEDDSGDEENEKDNTEALDEIGEGDWIFMTKQSLSKSVLPPHNAFLKHSPRTLDLRNHSGNLYLRHFMTSRMSSPRSHLTNFQSTNHGTMLLNSN